MKLTSRLVALILIAAGAVGACSMDRKTSKTQHQLLDTTWTLKEIQSMDDSVATPPRGKTFSVRLTDDGKVAVQADCNRGGGSYKQDGSSLEFGPMATTRMFCGPDGFDSRFLKELGFVRSYVIKDGKLFMATMADGAILEFVADGETKPD